MGELETEMTLDQKLVIYSDNSKKNVSEQKNARFVLSRSSNHWGAAVVAVVALR